MKAARIPDLALAIVEDGQTAIEQSVTGMLVGGTVKNTGVGAFYLAFDAAVAAILAAQGWWLARLARRDGRLELPRQGSSRAPAQARRWALPLLREFGIPVVIAVLPARFKVNWKAMFLYGPDVSYALTAIGGLAALTGNPADSQSSAGATRPDPLPARASSGWPPHAETPINAIRPSAQNIPIWKAGHTIGLEPIAAHTGYARYASRRAGLGT